MNRCETCDKEMTQENYDFCDICPDCLDGEPSPEIDELAERYYYIIEKEIRKTNGNYKGK